MKRIIIVVSFFFICFAASAQLMERESVQSSIKSGTRPEAGNFAFFIGPGLFELMDLVDFEPDDDVLMLPLVNIKYYLTDQFEIRLGTSMYQSTKKLDGVLTESTIGLAKDETHKSYFRVNPSFNYHFTNKNVIDTYAGAGIILGNQKDEIISENTYNIVGDYYKESVSNSSFVWGFSLYQGLLIVSGASGICSRSSAFCRPGIWYFRIKTK